MAEHGCVNHREFKAACMSCEYIRVFRQRDEALALLRQARPYVRIYPNTHELLAAIDAHLEGTG